MKRSLALILLACLLCFSSCDKEPTEEEKYLEQVRQLSKKYDSLYAATQAINQMQYVLSYWNSESYAYAQSVAKLSPALSSVYFPSISWEGGTELLALRKRASIQYIGIIETTKTYQDFHVLVQMDRENEPVYEELYRMRYSLSNDYIYECELIYTTNRA